ncbi:PREDICTED: taste receptor type 2 member 31-like [Chinchilla lanigera]|uniref:taste receptor type 2 member 31-like n=1 Tax=Chinchilla lanigera TaxID=34839 RepID=UPI000697D0BE|nr:PREDICTED: taste receptor type 2 member 31-like [Chinchilla lanigera]
MTGVLQNILTVIIMADFVAGNFSSVLVLRRVNSLIVLILLGTLVLLLSNLVMIPVTKTMKMKECEGNMTWKTKLSDAEDLFFLLLLYSLCKQLRKMQLHGKRSQDSRTKIHAKVVQSVVSFLLLFVVYSISPILTSWSLL